MKFSHLSLRRRVFLFSLFLSLSVFAEIPTNELTKEIAARRSKVAEFPIIAKLAEERGLRVFLFGGTAAGFAHYVKWDILREKGASEYQKEKFDYDYTSIYRSNQDLDIVVTRADGQPESPAELEEFQKILQERFPFVSGNQTAWEVRGLKTTHGSKEALLDNPDFSNQNTDSNSTGLIELTKSEEPIIKDLRDWKSPEPHFLKDVAQGKLHFYYSPKHFTTSRAKNGDNPEILSVIRYLTKAFQYKLEIGKEDLKQISRIVAEYLPQGSTSKYASKWIEKNGKKLLQNAIDIEEAWDTLESLGLRKKLIEKQNNPTEEKSLAWWLSKEPLRTKGTSLSKAQPTGKTAKDLGIELVAHETSDIDAYESITRSVVGKPNVFVSRASATGERAVHGSGFYTRIGEKGATGSGFHIRFKVNPEAREGIDFHKKDDFVVWKTGNMLSIVPESIKMSPAAAVNFLFDPKNRDERGLRERLLRRMEVYTPETKEVDELLALASGPDANTRARMLNFLARTNWKISKVQERIQYGLQDSHNEVIKATMEGIGEQKNPSPEILKKVMAILKGDNSNLHHAATSVLHKHSPLDLSLHADLKEGLKSSNEYVRHEIVSLLGRNRIGDANTVQSIFEIFLHSKGAIKEGALRALAGIQPERKDIPREILNHIGSLDAYLAGQLLKTLVREPSDLKEAFLSIFAGSHGSLSKQFTVLKELGLSDPDLMEAILNAVKTNRISTGECGSHYFQKMVKTNPAVVSKLVEGLDPSAPYLSMELLDALEKSKAEDPRLNAKLIEIENKKWYEGYSSSEKINSMARNYRIRREKDSCSQLLTEVGNLK